MYKLFFLIIFSLSSLEALPSKIAIGYNPATDFSFIYNGKNISPNIFILMVEEEFTNSNCSNKSARRYILTETEDPEAMKKYKEVIEKENNNKMIDPASKLTPHFTVATHILKGKVAIYRKCAMVDLRLEDRKGCIVAHKKISASNIKNREEIFTLAKKAASSLRYQICNSKFNEKSCFKSSYTDKQLYKETQKKCKKYYYSIITNTEYSELTKKHRPKGAAIQGPMILTDSYLVTKQSKQVLYINPISGVVKIVAIKDGAKSRYDGQKYRFDKKNCVFVNKRSKTRIDESLEPSLARVVKHNIFNAKSKGAFIEIEVINNNFRKKFKVPWSSLKGSGSWSGSGSKNKYDAPSDVEQMFMNSKIYKTTFATGKAMANSGFLKQNNDNARKVAPKIGMSKEQLCTIYSAEFLVGVFSDVENSFNAKIKVNISPASKQDIKKFKLYAKATGADTIRAREIEISKFEKEADGIFAKLENSIYDNKKDAWDKAYKKAKKEEQDKKNLEEFDNISIDDLEMFSN